MFRNPPIDPFDHSHCFHPRPRWPLEITPLFRIDLLEYLHQMWKYAMYGNTTVVVSMLEQLNDFLVRSSLGLTDDIDAEVIAHDQLTNDLDTLRNPQAFGEELRKLLEDDKRARPDWPEDLGGEPPNGPVG